MSNSSLEAQIICLGVKNNIQQLQELIQKNSIQTLKATLNDRMGHTDFITFWTYLLLGFDTSKQDALEKRFACVKCFLDGLLKIEITYTKTYDLISRLCQDLHTFPSDQLIEILEYCMDGMRAGDPKCIGWKDLLPDTLNVLSTMTHLNVNSIIMSGSDYRALCIRNLCTMRWPNEVITPIADMFKELHLSSNETFIVLNKFAGAIQSFSPSELPALSYQLFSMCTTAAQIIVPILALERYFYRFYYKKLFADMMSNSTDFDSIDKFSDKELREAEETIFHHLNYCTQYKISEIQMFTVLKNFTHMPDVILTPFVLSAILTMTAANRDPDSRLSSSALLPFLRTVIRNNEEERVLADYSVWCRDSLQRRQVNLEHIFNVLIDQNKDGKDVITPGLVNLAFMLLKARNSPTLNSLAIGFLTKFIRKRFIFGQGIIKKIAEWMVVEQDQYQYAECLINLSVADTFTVSECVKTINYVMDFFLWIPGEQALRMMSFIFPILKISPIVRDAFIDVLRKAMSSSDIRTRRMAVYGFCMILKQLNNSNSQRSQLGAAGMCTQHSISGFSLMSQATLGCRSNPQRHFDMLTLEIIGVLRNCFSQTLDIKCTLYENLQRAVELNPKLVPHILQFIDWHFRAYFHAPTVEDGDDDDEFVVHFVKIVHANDEHEHDIEVKDNLGRLILFISHCLTIFEKCEGDYDVREMKRILNTAMEKLIAKDLKLVEATGSLTYMKNELIAQQLNFIEGLMAFALLTSKQTNENVKYLIPLFREHHKLSEGLKSLSTTSKKGGKKIKNPNETEASTTNVTINGVQVKKMKNQLENIWDLSVIEKILRLLHEDIVPFAAPRDTTALRANCELVRYVLEVTSTKIEGIRLEPEYKQLVHSKRTLKYLTDITKVVYERCIKRLPELWNDFDTKTAVLAAECFQQCLLTANSVYKKKFVDVFLKGFDFYSINKCQEAPGILHDIIDEFMQQQHTAKDESLNANEVALARKIPYALLQCLEVLYDNISYGNRMTTESYTWILNFCKTYEVHTKDMSLVHKLLFTQRQKTHSGAFLNMIALQFGDVLGTISDMEHQDKSTMQRHFELKSITLNSVESCLQYLYAALRKQIEDVDYFIAKANNQNYKYRIVAEDDRDICLTSLRSLERSICSQLIHISNTLFNLTNVCIPLGACMDSLLKLLMVHYLCLKNLAKHLLNCCANMKLSIQSTKFDLLLHVVGKPLPTNVYALITYIEANIFDENSKKKSNPQAEKAKVLRETKLIPKTILYIENFNKHVILLAKKTNDSLANFLHYGTVRDFRIKTSELKAAIDRTLSHSSDIECDPSEQGDEVCEILDEEETLLRRMEAESADMDDIHANNDGNDGESISTNMSDDTPGTSEQAKSKQKSKTTARTTMKNSSKKRNDANDGGSGDGKSVETTPEDEIVIENESNEETTSQVLKNLAKINKKAKKRTLRELEQNDPIVRSATPPEPEAKRRRGRLCKK